MKTKNFALGGIALMVGLVMMSTGFSGSDTDTDSAQSTAVDQSVTYPETIARDQVGMSQERYQALASNEYGMYSFHAAHGLQLSINFNDHGLMFNGEDYSFKENTGNAWSYINNDPQAKTQKILIAQYDQGLTLRLYNKKDVLIKTLNADFATMRGSFQESETQAIRSELVSSGIAYPRVYDCPGYKLLTISDGEGLGSRPRVMFLTDRNFKHLRGFIPGDTGVYATDPDGNQWGVNKESALKNDGQQVCQINNELSDKLRQAMKEGN